MIIYRSNICKRRYDGQFMLQAEMPDPCYEPPEDQPIAFHPRRWVVIHVCASFREAKAVQDAAHEHWAVKKN